MQNKVILAGLVSAVMISIAGCSMNDFGFWKNKSTSVSGNETLEVIAVEPFRAPELVCEEYWESVAEKYADIIGETIPGERIVELSETENNKRYDIWQFDDLGYTHEFYLFAYDEADFLANQTTRLEDVNIAKKSLVIDDDYNAVYYKQDYVTMGDNSYEFFRKTIQGFFDAEAVRLDVEPASVKVYVNDAGETVSIVGELAEYIIPEPEHEEDEEGYILAFTDAEYFKYREDEEGNIIINAYEGNGGNKLIFPETIEDKTVIGIEQLDYVEGITSVVVPGCVEYLNDTFMNWTDLTSLTLNEGLVSMSSNVISGTSITALSIPSTVTSIGESFYANSGLTDFTVPAGITDLTGIYAGSAVESIIIPGTVVTIGDNAFYGCTNLTTVFIQEGTTSIGALAFADCPVLQAVAVPDSVIEIDAEAFKGSNIMLVGNADSYAAQFAAENNISFAVQ